MVAKTPLPSETDDKTERPRFKARDVIKILLWCERHCCLCEKSCDTNIEIHHIEQEGSKKKLSNIDNAIPLCFDCHGRINSYNPKHGVGTAYKVREIKTRRDQIYEKHTRHLVPITHFEITQVVRRNLSFPLRQLPDVGFNLEHVDPRFLPVTAKVEVKCLLDKKDQGIIIDHSGYYNGKTHWHLNPSFIIFGHFSVPEKCVTHVKSGKDFKIEVRVTIIDQYGREHRHLPLCWTYFPEAKDWYIEPRSFTTWT
jgi:hypothetical protein